MKQKAATKKKIAVLRKPVTRAGISLTSGETNSTAPHESAFREVLDLIESARQRAFQAVNTELIDLYWNVGESISRRIASDGWGKSTIVSLATYIGRRDPNARGFSAQNLWRMRQFYETWSGEKKLSPLVRELSWTHNLLATMDNEVVEYALSRSLSPALIAEYQTALPDKKLLQRKLHEFYQLALPATEAPKAKPRKPRRP